MTTIPIQVYGINLLVRHDGRGPADVRVHCPKGSPIRYGEVVARGDGFDEGANAFREMPDRQDRGRLRGELRGGRGALLLRRGRGVPRHPARLRDPVVSARVARPSSGPARAPRRRPLPHRRRRAGRLTRDLSASPASSGPATPPPPRPRSPRTSSAGSRRRASTSRSRRWRPGRPNVLALARRAAQRAPRCCSRATPTS